MKTRSFGLASCLLAFASLAGAEVVTYERFGAKGDGVTDDLPSIVAAHREANERGLPVKARDGATYYIGGQDLTAEIKTDVDFGSAVFFIDEQGFRICKIHDFRLGIDHDLIGRQLPDELAVFIFHQLGAFEFDEVVRLHIRLRYRLFHQRVQ